MQADNRFCRNCPHHRDSHLSSPENRYLYNKVCFGQEQIKIKDLYYIEFCRCREYLPKDNLEYLEYCEAKRNSSNETSKR
jgi:hypothetical protein